MKVELSHQFFQGEDSGVAFDAVFIRAPAILKVTTIHGKSTMGNIKPHVCESY